MASKTRLTRDGHMTPDRVVDAGDVGDIAIVAEHPRDLSHTTWSFVPSPVRFTGPVSAMDLLDRCDDVAVADEPTTSNHR